MKSNITKMHGQQHIKTLLVILWNILGLMPLTSFKFAHCCCCCCFSFCCYYKVAAIYL